MRTKLRVGITAVILIAVLGVGPASATQPGQNGDIFFTSQRDGNREVYLVHPDGSGLVNFTQNGATDDWPAAAPNPTIAFTSNRDGNDELYQQGLFATSPSRLTNNAASDSQPAVTDIGTAWVSTRDGNEEIYVDPLTVNVTQNPAADFAPTWSPDAHRIAFATNRDGNNEIYAVTDVIDQDYSVTRLTNDPASDAAPNWSPDGTRIAFETNRDGNFEIYVMNTDGTGLVNLTNNPASDRQPAWSPDGSKLVFQSLRDGNFEIYTMNANGTGQTRLTNDPAADVNADWGRLYFPGYPRPKGATPVRVPLVPSFRQCTAPNKTHGAPLAYPSCNEISPISSQLYAPQASNNVTIGTPSANGAAANFTGYVSLSVVPGSAGPPDDADVKLKMSVTDIRCFNDAGASFCGNLNVSAGKDYGGSLEGRLPLRITDRANPPSSDGTGTGTVEDTSISYTVPCAQTSQTTIGSACSIDTTLDALIPGVVQETLRSVWELDAIGVRDGGADGDGSTLEDNEPFLTQGLFVP